MCLGLHYERSSLCSLHVNCSSSYTSNRRMLNECEESEPFWDHCYIEITRSQLGGHSSERT